MNGRIPRLRGRTRTALLACLLLVPCTTWAALDLSGVWQVRTNYFSMGENVETVHIQQDGTSLRYGVLAGTIDPDSGEFHVTMIRGCARPVGIYATASDSDHFTGIVGGEWDPLPVSVCREFFGGGPISGVRVSAIATPNRHTIPVADTNADPTPGRLRRRL